MKKLANSTIIVFIFTFQFLIIACEETNLEESTPDTTPPIVSITSDSPSQFTSEGEIEFTVTATDESGIQKIEIFEGENLMEEGTTIPFIYTQTITAAHNGTLSFTAKAYDKANPANTSTSVPIEITVNISTPLPPDTKKPVVTLSANKTNFTEAGTLKLTAQASDESGIKKVEFYKGGNRVATQTTSPYIYEENITQSQNGEITYYAKAFDNATPYNTKNSSQINVIVNISAGGGGNGSGCGQGLSGTHTTQAKIRDGDATHADRHVEITTSNAYVTGEPAPIVIALHGSGGSVEHSKQYGFLTAINEAGDAAILVYPQGIDWNGWGIGWNEDVNGYDMPLFDNILTYLEANYCADLSRVFVTGFSWGGDMVNALVCARGDDIRGVANFSGGEIYNNLVSCPTQNYPACYFRYGYNLGAGGDGPYTLKQFQDTEVFFRTVLDASTHKPYDPSPCVEYTDSTQPLVICAYPTMGHEGPVLNDARVIWAFWKGLP